ncbi:hypothetical protein COT75_03015 [Candidatus Beckwithbacteria bacterium CG10_big_fil_rev_8_21_14_0_10_34_10]|uniref:N-acetyltransferase domain-containing protein n=1 Tax=Candidatus Beckwithbacteria bacterium CG10_big_fil_rev_8_21_14_0_10_34_10 TaxID=1974495 RepID=A0A2H0W971_9BACT|nr:MAG: hypothetical protein COT75_03015 [Candidatus Beckwithbacteria bacterium CG10_big_fil_rev_8_21_14_0_10_34_10]
MKKSLNVFLVPFKWEHIYLTFKWIKDLSFRSLFMMRGEISWERHKKYFKDKLLDSSQRVYAILYDDQHVGNCGLKNLSCSKKTAEIWIYIGDSLMHKRGIGKKATELLIKKAFKFFRLNLVYLHLAEFNTRAYRLYKKLDFREVLLDDNDQEWLNRGCKIIRMELRKKT